MHIAFYVISTMTELTGEAGQKLLCAKSLNWFLLLWVLFAWTFCTALLWSVTSLGLLLPQANLGFWKHIFFPEWDKTWNRTDLLYTKLLTQQEKKQTKERNIFTKVSTGTLLIGIKKKQQKTNEKPKPNHQIQ